MRHGATGIHLAGEIEAASRVRLELFWDADKSHSGQRQRLVNGQRASLAEHLAVLPVVSWTAKDTEILIGSPAERRRFLDRGVLGRRPSSLAVLSRYRKALEEKRRLLDRSSSEAEWQTWNRVLAEAASELILLRAAYTEKLTRFLGEILESCQLGFPPIELRYLPSPRCGFQGAERIYDELASVGIRERHSHRLLLGPHRDDLQILWDGHVLRRVASAGERKALGLALVTAHGEVLAESGRQATYLLDDVDTELDRQRLESLWSFFGGAHQLFASSNRPWVWETIEVDHRWRCEAGRIEEI